jgi:hypothetical protein
MALRDPRGDDPDHARVPTVRREHVRGRIGAAERRTLLGHLRLGLEQDPRLDVPALDVDRVKLGRHGLGPRHVGGEQQLQTCVGAVQPPGRVDARREPEPDRAGVDPAGIHARDRHQRLEPGLAGGGERPEPLAHEAPVLPHQRHAVGHRGERDDVEVRVGARGIHPGRFQQRLRQQVRDARRAQLRARVAADRRVHDRRVRQPAVGARRMVVGHHDVESGRARRGDLLHRRDRAVHGDEQLRPARGKPLDGRHREAIAVVDPARQVPVDVGAQRPQRADEHGGRAHPVDVVVPVHGDTRATLHVREDRRRALAQPAERVERMADVRLQERARGRRIAHPAPHQDLGDHVRDAQHPLEPLGGGVVVGRGREADGGRRHEAHRTSAGGRNRRFTYYKP